jgi:hypothetical protein
MAAFASASVKFNIGDSPEQLQSSLSMASFGCCAVTSGIGDLEVGRSNTISLG